MATSSVVRYKMKRLMVLMVLALGGWIGAQGSSWADGMPPGTAQPQSAPAAAPASAAPAPVAPTRPAQPDAYTRAMLIGYAAAEQGDYQTALINFRRALAARPNDRYAQAAIRNMESFIAEQRAAVRRREIATLQGRLAAAVEQTDWACAATTVDQLTTYFPAASLERAQLVAYRGEITGFLEARTNVETWSTVCLGLGQP
ncbi:MAG: hypothetical protein ICV62_07995 [Cyanobacteria bacterium Co-bin13]|nr:hypothetical protein [Cyanobacteria bacterium Co-bin13]